MNDIRDFIGETLAWVRRSPLKRDYELLAGKKLSATLRWQKPSGSLAVGEAADGTWSLKRSGFLGPHVTVRLIGADANLGIFRPNWRGEGLLTFADGHQYHWLNKDFWGSEWVFANPYENALVHLRPQLPPLEHDSHPLAVKVAEVRFEPAAADVPHVSLLAILGWYLLNLMAEDASVMTGAV